MLNVYDAYEKFLNIYPDMHCEECYEYPTYYLFPKTSPGDFGIDDLKIEKATGSVSSYGFGEYLDTPESELSLVKTISLKAYNEKRFRDKAV